MTFRELAVLLPCHSLEDFPVYHEGLEADQLLVACCAPWHPALVAGAGAVPTWHRIDIPPENLSGRLLLVPPFCDDRLPTGFADRCEKEGARLVRESTCEAAIAAATRGLDGPSIDSEFAADFLALGFCRLQMELLTRQMRYSTTIDETHFETEAVAAAEAAVAGELQTARDHLSQCFEALYDARKHFYPVDVHLLDITLLAATTPGQALEAELADETPKNIVADGSTICGLHHQSQPWTKLVAAIDGQKACVTGGSAVECELPLWPLESTLAALRSGINANETLFGAPPTIYARRRAGLWPGLVQLLTKLGYQGALHFTLDDGRFPLGPQAKTRWEGLDASVLDIFARVPADAAKPETFLSLSRTMSDSMDSDHVATVAFAHWPGATSPWYDVLRRICRQSGVLGKFTLLDDYFMHTDMPGQLSRFEADEYRTPYLKQAIIRGESDPISSIVETHQDQALRTSLSAVSTVCDLIAGSTDVEFEDQPYTQQLVDDALTRLAGMLPRTDKPPSPRALVFNSASYPRRIGLEIPQWENPPQVAGAVIASGASGQRKFALVEVPSLGFAWIEPGNVPTSDDRKSIVEENSLANEFFEVKINRATGGIGALYSYSHRGNQLSQQIAFRTGSGRDAVYTKMQAESVEVTASCPAYGEIVSRGGLVDETGRRVAAFRQTTGVWAGSRAIHLAIELSELEEPRANPWNSYYAARFAWPNEQALLWRGVSASRQRTDAGRIEAPEFVDVAGGSGTVTILTGGLPYHRRSDARMLDSLLVVRGERQRRFDMAIGVDLPHPAAAAFDLITPQAVRFETAPPAVNSTGWFFHTGANNLVATHWRVVGAPDGEASGEGGKWPVNGFAARFLEVGGTAGRVPLRAFRRVSKARQVDFLGETILQLSVDDDKIMLDCGANEFIEVEALWG